MFTCLVRYVVDLEKLPDFEDYARSWISLIDKYGGTHHGYFIPGVPPEAMPDASFSFPGLGTEGILHSPGEPGEIRAHHLPPKPLLQLLVNKSVSERLVVRSDFS